MVASNQKPTAVKCTWPGCAWVTSARSWEEADDQRIVHAQDHDPWACAVAKVERDRELAELAARAKRARTLAQRRWRELAELAAR